LLSVKGLGLLLFGISGREPVLLDAVSCSTFHDVLPEQRLEKEKGGKPFGKRFCVSRKTRKHTGPKASAAFRERRFRGLCHTRPRLFSQILHPIKVRNNVPNNS
jgi:hypothetical protein